MPSKGSLSLPPIKEATHAVFLRRDMQSNAQVNTDVAVCNVSVLKGLLNYLKKLNIIQ